jgi:TolB-like protein/DNA-binding winged helix-turn-helix (wHTH) protein/Tfp pilus assembly protein PilF
MEGDFRLGEWLVCPLLNTVQKDGQTVRLEHKFMQVLVCLAGRPSEVVSKDELIRTVWTDTFVTDDVLTRAVSELRRALKDDAKQPHIIETVSKNGYRLIGPVQRVIAESSHRRRSFLLPGAFLIGLLVAGLGVAFVYRARFTRARVNAGPVQSIAVLPLDDLSHDPAQEYFADGMTDELINELAQVKALRVVSRTSVMQFKGSRKPLSEVAKALNVDAVVEGAMLRSGGRVRITAELIDARLDRQLWAHNYEGDTGDVLKLQSSIADAITREIQIAVTTQEQQRMVSARRVDPDALDAYLHGQFYWNQFSKEGMQKAVEYFQKAIDKDPNWAAAYAGQAHAYHELSFYQPPKQVMPKAKWAAEKAIQIDPSNAEAHAAMGWVKWMYEWDWQGGETEFKHAIELRPNSWLARGQYAVFLDAAGRYPEALEEERRALQADPLSLVNNSVLGGILAENNNQLDQAIQKYLMVIGIDPQFGDAHGGLGFVYATQGRFQDAVSEVQTAFQYDPDPQYLGSLAWIYAVSGQREKARATLRELNRLSKQKYIPASVSAGALAALGEKEKAIEALEKGVEDRESGLVAIGIDRSLDSLRSDPRFERLLRVVGIH